MQLRMKLKPKGNDYLELPFAYNHLLQSAIYKNILPELAEFLHDSGFQYEKRTFKMFSFSRILGPFEIDKKNGKISFKSPEIYITTPLQELTQSIGNFILKDDIRLGTTFLTVSNLELKNEKVEDESIVLQTLSPVTAYSTANLPDGRKYTVYFHPKDKKFREIIDNNLRKKYYALYEENPPAGEIGLYPLNNEKLNIITYKGIIIKGYSFKMRLKGPKKLLQVALDTGLGSKNSQGFGCVKTVS